MGNTSMINIRVNGHEILVTTDQKITDEYLQEIADHVRKLEGTPTEAPIVPWCF